ncbi:unnamed protein product [Symbiodinium natans]|uniref:Uncharacterized protein n=1 Tax=Symbiodinium natans TaxID=878477 RepID=A0A812T1J8_9DINO|nr:unnamed protein product [Symbiodinium natans]
MELAVLVETAASFMQHWHCSQGLEWPGSSRLCPGRGRGQPETEIAGEVFCDKSSCRVATALQWSLSDSASRPDLIDGCRLGVGWFMFGWAWLGISPVDKGESGQCLLVTGRYGFRACVLRSSASPCAFCEIRVGDLLAAAGVHLDQECSRCADFNVTGEKAWLRNVGVELDVTLFYTNLWFSWRDPSTWLLPAKEPSFELKVSARQPIEGVRTIRTISAAQSYIDTKDLQNESLRVTRRAHGIRLHFRQQGVLGAWDPMSLAYFLLQSCTFLGVAWTLTELLCSFAPVLYSALRWPMPTWYDCLQPVAAAWLRAQKFPESVSDLTLLPSGAAMAYRLLRLGLALVTLRYALGPAYIQDAGSRALPRRAAVFGSAGALASSPSSVRALPGSPRFAGTYDDPAFPGCPREIVPQGRDVIVRGVDGPAADCAGKAWQATGRRGRGMPDTLQPNELLLDFSARGGPSDVIAVWVPGLGLRFPDGSEWRRRR